ncbi:MAG: hypothetical protein KZQ89_13855 [Candidatus Thiodiazotropha sp. (ex Lucinoma kastoroae)]|nr:hypothetical protein [Candidatus Thiodiazotropha sp. (ex Rostrolucina anterorostrata)]MCU7849050.1 hypothetical protein [Candidatus Thiodiazotropha sp. (ex Lucinoma kastoroae)]MCU7859663.1 hypothetical protein [Candidatus Thiodiazotropha sp. (ex Lucinoma kastoroae)]
MIQLQWNRKFEAGHERIDFEHKIFLGLIRDVSQAPQQGIQKERILRHLNEVKKYAVFHFTSEENIMFDETYPDRYQAFPLHFRCLTGLITD